MRDVVAIVFVFLLVAFALSMASSLHFYRRSHTKLRRAITASGQVIVAEIPGRDKLRFFTEDHEAFHWDDRVIPKGQIRAARVLISGAPISVCLSREAMATQAEDAPGDSNPAAGRPSHPPPDAPIEVTQPEGIERDRWDVTIETEGETVVVECGAIRERVSQELARQVFETVRNDIESRPQSSSRPTTPVR